MRTFILIVIFLVQIGALQAQANLSVQGTVLKTSGAAVDDRPYKMTFKLYTTDAGGTALWMEIQPEVQITGGVYSATLGTVTPLNIAFDQTYYLGVTVEDGTELIPRAQLTSAPYALSLIGQTNKFPSTGAVGVGTISPAAGSKLHVKDAGGAAKVTVEGTSAATIELKTTSPAGAATITYNGTNVTISNFNLIITDDVVIPAGKTISYNGNKDWRLIDVDNFDVDEEGWGCFTDYNLATTATFERIPMGAPMNTGFILRPTGNAGNAFRKTLSLNGVAHTQVKVIFTAYFFNSVDGGEGVYGAFSTVNPPVLNYTNPGEAIIGCSSVTTGAANEVKSQFYGALPEGQGWTRRMEMVVHNSADIIHVILDSTMTEAITNENYAIGNIEIWVK